MVSHTSIVEFGGQQLVMDIITNEAWISCDFLVRVENLPSNNHQSSGVFFFIMIESVWKPSAKDQCTIQEVTQNKIYWWVGVIL